MASKSLSVQAGKAVSVPARVAADRVITQLRQAEKALQQATTIQQAKIVADVAAAQEVFAHRQRLGDVCTGYAHEIKIYALAKLGELLSEMPKAGGAGVAGPGRGKTNSRAEFVSHRETLADLGVNPRASMVAQQLAALPIPVRDAIAKGERTITQALREKKAVEIQKAVSLPTAKYRVIYADPPWSYGNTQPDYQTEQRDHYPVMSLADICALPVGDMIEPHAVLFLWVTSPILRESFEVMDAWGFGYKASFVWDKVRHNMGHYNSVRHEFLLIGVKGSCQPDVQKLYDSVITEERTQHSVKPVIVYEIIDTIYPHGKRLELFARTQQPRHGWDVYGFEATA